MAFQGPMTSIVSDTWKIPQVLLAIRGLGKSKSVLQQMPRHSRRPEKAVLHLMESGDPGFFLARLGLWGGDSPFVSSKIKEDLTNGPLGKVQKLLDIQV